MPVFYRNNRPVEARQFLGQVIEGLERDGDDFFVRNGKDLIPVRLGDYVTYKDGEPAGVIGRYDFEAAHDREPQAR